MYSSLKTLNTKEAAYHGGALNGVDMEKILKHTLDCNSFQDNKLLECIEDDQMKSEGFHEMLLILAKSWDILRHPPKAGPGTKFSDEELSEAIKWCEAWVRSYLNIFPRRI